MEELFDLIYNKGPVTLDADHLINVTDLFRSRAALYYTPTENVPDEWVGEGRLDITVPLPFPIGIECLQNRVCWGPRLWVDLVQRATGKVRWKPMIPARVHLVRRDFTSYGIQQLWDGVKALLDALKVSTTGRYDGKILYYFGAIRDDDSHDLDDLNISEEVVRSPTEAQTRIIVEPAS